MILPAALVAAFTDVSRADEIPPKHHVCPDECNTPAGPNVNRATFTYDKAASTFTVGGQAGVATTNGADGLVFGPNGNLLVGGGGPRVHEVDPNGGGVIGTRTTPDDVFHLSLDPTGAAVYGGGVPGAPDRIALPLPPGTSTGGAGLSLSGDATTVDSIAFPPGFSGFAGGRAFYTSSGPGGNGQIGVVTFSSPTVATTEAKLSMFPASHSIVYDPFTNTFVTFGANHVSQISNNLTSPSFVSDLLLGTQLDQGAVDGQGHAFVADNGGNLGFVDYSTTGFVGLPDFLAQPFLADCLAAVALSTPADLSVTKTAGPTPAYVGQALPYTLTAKNAAGGAGATGVTVTDTLPAGVAFVSATPTQGSCTGTTPVTCNLGSLASGASATIAIVVRPTQPGTIVNTASIGGDQPDPNRTNNTGTVTTSVTSAADVSITKTASPDPVSVGGTLVYTIKVANAGPSPATGVVVTDPLPANVAYVSSTASQGGCSQASGVVTCNLGALANGGSATVTVTVRATGKNLRTTNTAKVKATEADPVPTNNTGAATTAVLAAEGSAYGVRLSAPLVNLAPTPSVSRTTPGTSSTTLANITAGILVSAQGLAVSTEVGPGASVNSSAQTAAVNLVISLVTASAVKTTCAATSTTRTGATTIDRITVRGRTLNNVMPAPNTLMSLLGGSLVLNEQVVTPYGITVNGLHLRLSLLGVDVVVSQSRCVVDP